MATYSCLKGCGRPWKVYVKKIALVNSYGDACLECDMETSREYDGGVTLLYVLQCTVCGIELMCSSCEDIGK
jgi:hypothetical protein